MPATPMLKAAAAPGLGSREEAASDLAARMRTRAALTRVCLQQRQSSVSPSPQPLGAGGSRPAPRGRRWGWSPKGSRASVSPTHCRVYPPIKPRRAEQTTVPTKGNQRSLPHPQGRENGPQRSSGSSIAPQVCGRRAPGLTPAQPLRSKILRKMRRGGGGALGGLNDNDWLCCPSRGRTLHLRAGRCVRA